MHKSLMLSMGLAVLWSAAGCAPQPRLAAVDAGTQTAQRLESSQPGQAPLRYLLYLPPEYALSRRAWPMVLFLHGAGERGDDLERVKVHGLPKLVAQGRDFPFIIVSPQCPAGQRWQPEPLLRLLDRIEADYRVDRRRQYVTGLSMGGYGTWQLILAQPERFAAAAPICGRSSPELAPAIAHLPLWVFHGERDNIVPFHHSQQMVDALRAAGGNVRFTAYPQAGHDSWTETYNNPELYAWLLAQRRKR